MDMSLHKLQEIVKDREAWRVAVRGSLRVGQDWETEQQAKHDIKKEKFSGDKNTQLSYILPTTAMLDSKMLKVKEGRKDII